MNSTRLCASCNQQINTEDWQNHHCAKSALARAHRNLDIRTDVAGRVTVTRNGREWMNGATLTQAELSCKQLSAENGMSVHRTHDTGSGVHFIRTVVE